MKFKKVPKANGNMTHTAKKTKPSCHPIPKTSTPNDSKKIFKDERTFENGLRWLDATDDDVNSHSSLNNVDKSIPIHLPSHFKGKYYSIKSCSSSNKNILGKPLGAPFEKTELLKNSLSKLIRAQMDQELSSSEQTFPSALSESKFSFETEDPFQKGELVNSKPSYEKLTKASLNKLLRLKMKEQSEEASGLKAASENPLVKLSLSQKLRANLNEINLTEESTDCALKISTDLSPAMTKNNEFLSSNEHSETNQDSEHLNKRNELNESTIAEYLNDNNTLSESSFNDKPLGEHTCQDKSSDNIIVDTLPTNDTIDQVKKFPEASSQEQLSLELAAPKTPSPLQKKNHFAKKTLPAKLLNQQKEPLPEEDHALKLKFLQTLDLAPGSSLSSIRDTPGIVSSNIDSIEASPGPPNTSAESFNVDVENSSEFFDDAPIASDRKRRKRATITSPTSSALRETKSKRQKLESPENHITTITENDFTCICSIAQNFEVTDSRYCDAEESLDDEAVKCNKKATFSILSDKLEQRALCIDHIYIWEQHMACPACGLFCIQGEFMQCTCYLRTQRQHHLYHARCFRDAKACVHCGSPYVSLINKRGLPKPQLRSTLTKPEKKEQSKARITITRTLPEIHSEATNVYKVESLEISDRILNTFLSKEELTSLFAPLCERELPNLRFSEKGLLYAIKSGNVENTLSLLISSASFNYRFKESEDTPLHVAARQGNLLLVHLILQLGGGLDNLNKRLLSPLMSAIVANKVNVVHYLIMAGASFHFIDEDGLSCLHLAAKVGSIEICQLILKHSSINIDQQDNGGWTPLMWACEHKHLDLVKFLLFRGATPCLTDAEQNTALHWATYAGNSEIVNALLDHGADLNSQNVYGDTPLHLAAKKDNYECAIILLLRNPRLEIKNKLEKNPIECCTSKKSKCYLAIKINSTCRNHCIHPTMDPIERVLLSDISRGKEHFPIQCVNGVDTEEYPQDFLYVMANCETCSRNIDRSITSLQRCKCEFSCNSRECVCANLSYKCWYDESGRLIDEVNLTDPPIIFECNKACLCWNSCNNRVVQKGITCRLQLFRTRTKGWGVRTLKDIAKGTFICEYIGEIISDTEADLRSEDSYLFDLEGEVFCLDACRYGNVSRFINHHCEPNLVPLKVFIEHQDLTAPHIALFAARDIVANEELGFDYGEKFWVIKSRYFTCDCGAKACKYSKDTIAQTLGHSPLSPSLANY